ncbi:hypothetical protein TWF132_004454 [Orbilia oligospora]|nr:hypothetical protein TWF132_004454 [Orbilia oligospora]
MSKDPNDRPSDALLGVLVTVLSVLVFGLLTLVTYLYLQLRKIHQRYKELLKESGTTSSLCQRIREQRKSAILHIVTNNDLEQQRDQYVSSPISQHSDYSLNMPECSKTKFSPKDIESIEPNSPEREPWGIRKVRSIERLTGLTKELSIKSDHRNHVSDQTSAAGDQNPFSEQEEIFEYDVTGANPIDSNFTLGGEVEMGHAFEVQFPIFRSPETMELDSFHEQIDWNGNKAQSCDPNLLAVPQPNCFTRTQYSVSAIKTTSAPIHRFECESNIPPHARSPAPQASYEVPLKGTSETYMTNMDLHGHEITGIGSLEHYDKEEVPRPFLERSFSLNLAYPDPAEEATTKNRNSPGTKLKLYLKNARSHRKSVGSTQGKSTPPSRSPEGTISKAKRDLFRLPKSSREESTPPPSNKEGALDNN